ncbi:MULTISPECIES: TetR/AcrR family transcriptional regulator [Yersinia]|uniref:TetR/AcrR family transcriptional regulator n=1 Tax=Yersinia TaxID=629 RepID=UPI0005E25232|nr:MULTISPECIES: TetR/AcrR family transcriptional regulator [Yersinia]OVZ99101.1 TetR family transcriptional regulator [Yersinia frederiksenii]RXA97676.1 TetR/AcrR family transcriptional regulator [Yersinia sp. 2105 StPb PI]CNI32803.1 TetR family transcription regulatory protein [Yersinia frederiksenii]CNI95469.1 TetR family transcription regulatory protein [Yersinia frederiksenii]CNK24178.1 TetR family transcription regulatory protein [Yersinia frederiksenii]
MGRSTKIQAESNRALIVEKASGLFRAHGIANVSVSDIMKAAGMTAGGFYKHFESKESLAQEAVSLAFDSSTTNWSNVSLEQGGNLQREIAQYYFTQKPTDKRCPMLAFGNDLMKRDNPSLAAECTAGINNLFEIFADTTTSSGYEDSDLVKFAAMVGANYLSELSSDPEFASRMKKAVLESL